MRAIKPVRSLWQLALAATLVLSLGLVYSAAGSVSPASASPSDEEAPVAAPQHHRRSDMRLDLVSRTYDSVADRWTVVVEARLNSNQICIPAIFDCIAEPGRTPAGARLVDVQCMNPWWGHLGVFTDTCLKQFAFAGHHQRFRFTYVTEPGAAPASLQLSTRFGRGIFPIILQKLAGASLTVNLDSQLTLAQDCPAGTLSSGDTVTCTITVANPSTSVLPLTASVVETIDPAGWATSPALTGGSCVAGVCTASTGAINPGDQAVLTFTATVAATQTGGDFTADTQVTWSGAPLTASSEITVAGDDDTELSVTKTANQTSAQPGQQVSWTITVTNDGLAGSAVLPATDVVLTDTAPAALTGLTVVYASGVGSWSCAAAVCTTATMPAGSTTFTATGRIAASAPSGSQVVNEVDVSWANDVVGPDYPVVAGGGVQVQGAVINNTTTTVPSTPTTVPTARPASLAFAG